MKTIDRYGCLLRVYDNGGRTCDRFTIIPPRSALQYRDSPGNWQAIGASENPFSPQGFGMHVNARPGLHLGKRVHWKTLPTQVQKFAQRAFPEFCAEGQQ